VDIPRSSRLKEEVCWAEHFKVKSNAHRACFELNSTEVAFLLR
jgi:hypothetical protein